MFHKCSLLDKKKNKKKTSQNVADTTFKDLGTYALAQREKKKAIHLYLCYPRSSWKLELHRIKNDYDDEEQHKDFGETEYTFNEVRWCVFLETQLISYSFTFVRLNFCIIFKEKYLQKFTRLCR